ncbi:hypothetical protein HanHA300_Chr15g0547711 [Helianthus annuus]|nr:hypothetical protein HanHA300_Chr15g0547711 [Helianthus annuus]KAJ0650845.1 hypothetical protein HanOQP8_Chr15g0554731 [Helianthus annuus]
MHVILLLNQSIIFPCACYLRLLHGHTTTVEITMCSVMILMGLVCAIVGTYTSLASIPG